MVTFQINSKSFDFLIDTGFDGQLVLPLSIAHDLELNEVGDTEFFTADGHESAAPVFLCMLNWFGSVRPTFALGTNSDIGLIGMELLKECRLTVDKAKNIELEK